MHNPTTEEIVRNLREIIPTLTFTREVDAVMDAADRLEELEAKQPRWISVEERLPEIAMRVIVNTDYARSIGQFIISSHGGIFMYDYTGQQMSGVTHWMPLPEPPKEDE